MEEILQADRRSPEAPRKAPYLYSYLKEEGRITWGGFGIILGQFGGPFSPHSYPHVGGSYCITRSPTVAPVLRGSYRKHMFDTISVELVSDETGLASN